MRFSKTSEFFSYHTGYSRELNGDDVDIKSLNVSASADYAISAWLTGSFSISHFEQDSEVTAAQDIERNMVMFQIAASWGP